MRNQMTYIVLGIVGSFCAAYGQTNSGYITSNEVWSGTVTITGDVIVTGGTLTIEPGTVVKFATTNNNVVYGDSNLIYLTVIGMGAIHADSEPFQSSIIMTTTSLLPAPGAWGGILVIANGYRSRLSNCVIEYAEYGVLVENRGSHTAPSNIALYWCSISNILETGLFVGPGNGASVSESRIYDCNIGCFFYGAEIVDLIFSYIYNVSAGIVCLAAEGYDSEININHTTIYNCDMLLSGNPKWWTGYGVYTGNCGGNLSLALRNSIISQCTIAGIKCSDCWSIDESYNCIFTGSMGLMEVEGCSPNPADIFYDPIFKDELNNDLSLDMLSPCRGAANDDYYLDNIGAYQLYGGRECFGGFDHSIRIISTPETVTSPNAPYSYQLTEPPVVVTCECELPVKLFRLVISPDSMTMSPSGLIQWQPGLDDIGFHQVSVEVVNGCNYTDTQSYQLEVVDPTAIRFRNPIFKIEKDVPSIRYDIYGRYKGRASDNPRGVPPGIYFLQSGDDGKTGLKKILVTD